MLRFIATAFHDVLRKTPSEAVLLDNYTRVCIILSEIINEVRCHWDGMKLTQHAC